MSYVNVYDYYLFIKVNILSSYFKSMLSIIIIKHKSKGE